jgi:GTP cyclohydrolase I
MSAIRDMLQQVLCNFHLSPIIDVVDLLYKIWNDVMILALHEVINGLGRYFQMQHGLSQVILINRKLRTLNTVQERMQDRLLLLLID